MPRFRMACLFPIAEQVTADGSPGRLTMPTLSAQACDDVSGLVGVLVGVLVEERFCVALSDNTAAETFPAS